LRIDMVERADSSMFESASSAFSPEAMTMMRTVAGAIKATPNRLTALGHTVSQRYAAGSANNWTLSTARADSTRRVLTAAGVDERRFRRIEGVADTDPFDPEDRTDPRNRRISVTLLYKDA
jgi:chemotaxis protein MotB